MGKFLTILALAVATALPSTEGWAQTADPGLSEARVRLACGSGRVVGAETLADGSIRVTCEQISRVPLALGGFALTPAGAGAISVVVLCIALCGGSDSESVTTSTQDPGGEP